MNTAYDLYSYLKQHHSTVTNSYHEALHQVDKREFHYFLCGTFLAYHPCRLSNLFSLLPLQQPHHLFFISRPKAFAEVKPYYTFAVHRTGLPEVKTSFQRRHYCQSPQCTTGDYHRCMYKEFLGMSQIFITFSLINVHSHFLNLSK